MQQLLKAQGQEPHHRMGYFYIQDTHLAEMKSVYSTILVDRAYFIDIIYYFFITHLLTNKWMNK